MRTRIPLALGASLLATGCAIHQTVKPVQAFDAREVCIVTNPEVRTTFSDQLRNTLQNKGYSVRMLAAGASTESCPVTATYTANWRWDLALYMARAEIRVYVDGKPAGEALYDSMSGGANMKKFIDANTKIAELVGQLFPGRVGS